MWSRDQSSIGGRRVGYDFRFTHYKIKSTMYTVHLGIVVSGWMLVNLKKANYLPQIENVFEIWFADAKLQFEFVFEVRIITWTLNFGSFKFLI